MVFPMQVNLAHTSLILKEANTANEGFSKAHKGSI